VVVYEDVVREKPSSKEEAQQFLKGLLTSLSLSLCFFPFQFPLFSYYIALVILPTWIADYSGGHAATVGSVLVTNLKTGFRKGEWDRVEVP
jgi:septum formation protein